MLSSLLNRLINSILVRLWTLVAAYAELHVEVPKPLSIMDWCTFTFSSQTFWQKLSVHNCTSFLCFNFRLLVKNNKLKRRLNLNPITMGISDDWNIAPLYHIKWVNQCTAVSQSVTRSHNDLFQAKKNCHELLKEVVVVVVTGLQKIFFDIDKNVSRGREYSSSYDN